MHTRPKMPAVAWQCQGGHISLCTTSQPLSWHMRTEQEQASDESHTPIRLQVLGAGKTEGAMDAANLLKPMLARGELRCIGATTLGEYREHVEKDAAFERRFQQVCSNILSSVLLPASIMGSASYALLTLHGFSEPCHLLTRPAH